MYCSSPGRPAYGAGAKRREGPAADSDHAMPSLPARGCNLPGDALAPTSARLDVSASSGSNMPLLCYKGYFDAVVCPRIRVGTLGCSPTLFFAFTATSFFAGAEKKKQKLRYGAKAAAMERIGRPAFDSGSPRFPPRHGHPRPAAYLHHAKSAPSFSRTAAPPSQAFFSSIFLGRQKNRPRREGMEHCAGFSLHSGSRRLKRCNPLHRLSSDAVAHLSDDRRRPGGFPYFLKALSRPFDSPSPPGKY
jgi:hypothetical protein